LGEDLKVLPVPGLMREKIPSLEGGFKKVLPVPGLLREKIHSLRGGLKVLPVPGLLREKMPSLERGLKDSPCYWPPEKEKAFLERRI
jgi:hypothetical protein